MSKLTNDNVKKFYVGGRQSGKLINLQIYNKLSTLEDLEEQLKIDFIIGGKAMLNGIYTKSYGFISGDLICLEKFRIYIPTYSVSLPFTGPVGYGKTWALTKEELEQ